MKGGVVWLTGLPCSGKTTIAEAAQKVLRRPTIVLDGDAVRKSFCSDLGFSAEERAQNMARVAHVARLLVDQGFLVLCSFVSPARAARAAVREILPEMLEVYVKCPVAKCEKRDVKGMYAEARAGKRPHFTGIGSHYEAPENPAAVLETDRETLPHTVSALLNLLWREDLVENAN